jgi:hypothetical protein
MQSASIDPETTFTSRWPEQGLPTTMLRGG